MPGPKPPEIVLSGDERAALERLARAHTTGPQFALRAWIVLLAAEGLSTSAVARRLDVEVGTACASISGRATGDAASECYQGCCEHCQGPKSFGHTII